MSPCLSDIPRLFLKSSLAGRSPFCNICLNFMTEHCGLVICARNSIICPTVDQRHIFLLVYLCFPYGQAPKLDLEETH